NIVFAARKHERPGYTEHAEALMDQVGISALGDRRPHELSGGQKQRVAIARRLILGPMVVFFDEPSAALVLQSSEDLARLLKRINHESQVVIVSHDLPFLEKVCQRGCLMENGKASFEGTIQELRQRIGGSNK